MLCCRIILNNTYVHQIWTIFLQVRQLHVSYFIQRNIRWCNNFTSVNFTEILLPNTNIESCDLNVSFWMLVICVGCWWRLFFMRCNREFAFESFAHLNISKGWMAVTLDVAMERPFSHFELSHGNLIGIFHTVQFQLSTYLTMHRFDVHFQLTKIDGNVFYNHRIPFLKSAGKRERRAGEFLCLWNRASDGKWWEYKAFVSS